MNRRPGGMNETGGGPFPVIKVGRSGLTNTPVQVTFRNEPIYDRGTLEWLNQFADHDLSGDQKRLLAYARAHGGRFTNRDYQKLIGIDLYGASNSIKVMIRKGVVRSTGKGSRVYEIVEDAAPEPVPEQIQELLSKLGRIEMLTNEQIRNALGVSRGSATRYLQRWVEAGWLRPAGRGRGSRYEPTAQLNASLSYSAFRR